MRFGSLFFCSVAVAALACCNGAHAFEQITLDSTWSEWDPSNLGGGVQTLSAESPTGYTASISGTVAETGEIAQAYQIFDPVWMNEVGDKVELSFDIQFNSLLGAINLDTDFRAGISSTANNSGAVYGFDAGGSAGGTSVRLRYDANGLTHNDDNGGAFDVGNINHSLNASGTLGSGGGTPAGDVLGESTTETHSFVLSLERVAGGLVGSSSWTSDAPGAVPVVNAYNAPLDDTTLLNGKAYSMDMIQIALLEENISTTYPASWTISNLTVFGSPVPEPTSALLVLGSLACAASRGRRA